MLKEASVVEPLFTLTDVPAVALPDVLSTHWEPLVEVTVLLPPPMASTVPPVM
jgi:hypothetical protein